LGYEKKQKMLQKTGREGVEGEGTRELSELKNHRNGEKRREEKRKQ